METITSLKVKKYIYNNVYLFAYYIDKIKRDIDRKKQPNKRHLLNLQVSILNILETKMSDKNLKINVIADLMYINHLIKHFFTYNGPNAYLYKEDIPDDKEDIPDCVVYNGLILIENIKIYYKEN